ncbi:MAG: tRNA (adenosine(37)-N6)-threonylcarbamoyltransferase complex dimerization subunit type 1 TsaB [Candidatus Saccharimonadales bacterium]
MILALRTDKPEAELYVLDSNGRVVASDKWQAHRELSDTLLNHIEVLLHSSQVDLSSLTHIVVYQGPGSFTGLRIGITVANTLAYSLGIPVVGISGGSWLNDIHSSLILSSAGTFVVPKYGAKVHITKPRK